MRVVQMAVNIRRMYYVLAVAIVISVIIKVRF